MFKGCAGPLLLMIKMCLYSGGQMKVKDMDCPKVIKQENIGARIEVFFVAS